MSLWSYLPPIMLHRRYGLCRFNEGVSLVQTFRKWRFLIIITCYCYTKVWSALSVIIIIKNEEIRVTLCENAAGALYFPSYYAA